MRRPKILEAAALAAAGLLAGDSGVRPPVGKGAAPSVSRGSKDPNKIPSDDELRAIAEQIRADHENRAWKKQIEEAALSAEAEKLKGRRVKEIISRDWGIDIDTIHQKSRELLGLFIVNPLDEYVIRELRKQAEQQIKDEGEKGEAKNIVEMLESAGAGLKRASAMEEGLKFIEVGNDALTNISYTAPREEDKELLYAYAMDLGLMLKRVGLPSPAAFKNYNLETAMVFKIEPIRGYLEKIFTALINVHQRLLLLSEKSKVKTDRVDLIKAAEMALKAIKGPSEVSGK